MVNHYRWDFIGLSTDSKPTAETSEKVTDGSTYYCSDNSKLYVWCKDNWYEKTVSGGGQYELPIASSETLGGIKVGNNLSINAETGVLDAQDTTYTAGTGISISAENEISATGGSGGDVFMLELSGSGANQKCVTPYADIKNAVNNKKLLMVHDIAVNNGSYDSYHTFGFCTYDGTTIGTTGTTQLAFICFERFYGGSQGNVKVKTLLLDNANQTLSNQGRFGSSNFLDTTYPTSAVSNKDGNILSEQALVNAIGILQNLTTTTKTDIVSAINELVTRVSALEG